MVGPGAGVQLRGKACMPNTQGSILSFPPPPEIYLFIYLTHLEMGGLVLRIEDRPCACQAGLGPQGSYPQPPEES